MDKNKILETAECAKINLNNLGSMVPGLNQTPFFKIVEEQLNEVIKQLEDEE